MPCAILQHVPFEGPAGIETWLAAHHHPYTITRLYQSAPLPHPETIDLLILLGGPMSVNDEQIHPWLIDEKALIRRLIADGKPVLGICLGAQLIAAALGARVYPGPQKEIGWFPVHAIHHQHPSAFTFPPSTLAFHWHGETFDLPPHAIHLASTPACPNQAFQIGDRVIGLQFHLETTPESARALVHHGRHELQPAPFIQTEQQILAAPPETYTAIHHLMSRIMTHLTHAR
ncbi:MAG TPA: gamma-glutamyl-gamma-aminobutyrate hydrolase family protein [Kiritimatiellia bacterium]|nr:gamma-glutamyl-gamma-aminobutyrate hydrolase family protein [Kiritimatiellia bacterium]